LVASKAVDAATAATQQQSSTGQPPPPLPPHASHVVIFVGPMEHHSNLLMWREAHCTVVEVGVGADGALDQAELAAGLEAHVARGATMLIGSFAAASNVTGICEHVDAVTVLLHKHGALACWDYASAGPHGPIDMNPSLAGEEMVERDSQLAAKDAVFLSPHKFPGGPGTPGVLVVKRRLLQNAVPVVPGGGTVFYVTSDGHRYLTNPEEREEGGTPNILGVIRCGLVFQLWQAVGGARIEARERAITATVLAAWGQNPAIRLLGPVSAARTPIISLMVAYGGGGGGRFLHWNFVSTLLSNLFGIQARGGCMCAGPYGHRLLQISPAAAVLLEKELLEKNELVRPGFVRLSFAYYMDDAEVAFVTRAVDFVATHGWKFLPQYLFFPETGVWRHRAEETDMSPHRRWLGSVSYATGTMAVGGGGTAAAAAAATGPPPSWDGAFAAAEALAVAAERVRLSPQTTAMPAMPDQTRLMSAAVRRHGLQWLVLPSEVASDTSTAASMSVPMPTAVRADGTIRLLPRFNAAGNGPAGENGSDADTATSKTANKPVAIVGASGCCGLL
jgi:selenocysteine lyase/cysteine desulfurase